MAIFLVGMNILLTSVPAAVLLYYMEHHALLPHSRLLALGMCYTVAHLKTYGRSFILALHYITHCSIFNSTFRVCDHVWKSGLCCLFGIPPGLYYPHHVGMHHAMDNVAPNDMSSTMPYRRGSRWDHFRYMVRFVVGGSFELPYRLCQMGKYDLAVQCVTGCTLFWTGTSILGRSYPVATLCVFWLPWLIVSFSLMQGNFKEHIFVDPNDEHNNYRSAFTCINAPSNALTFNNGYHIEHHEEPGLPWYRLPDLFLKNLPMHAAQDSFIFCGIGAPEVGSLVLHGKFHELARRYVNVGQPVRTEEELVAEFRRRLVPVAAAAE
jgi:fatty acid desaturase